EWVGYVKENVFEYTPIETFDKKQVILTNSTTTLWKDLNYQGKLGMSVGWECIHGKPSIL
ncbi:hypothetical protein, partial [Enterococcus faecalis]|uniref:hypothetical protein n=1 Tax=Enterococcus faecalis TaxID=1351 RepID=UPI000534F1DB